MSWFGSIISSLTGTSTPVPNFDFTFKHSEHDSDAVNWTSACGTNWTIKNGKKVNAGGSSSQSDISSMSSSSGAGGGGDDSSSNSDDVSIFVCDISQNDESLVRNVLKRAKGLMLPGVVRCFGATEYNNQIFIAVERCVPLKTVLLQRNVNNFYKINTNKNNNDDEDDENSSNTTNQQQTTTPEEKFHVAVAYGMNTISNALTSLHRNKLLHGAVNLDSVFALEESGEWRLFGYDLVSGFDDVVSGNGGNFNTRNTSRVLAPHRLAPEMSNNNNNASAQSLATVAQIDSWGLGILLFETFFHFSNNNNASKQLPTSSTSNDLRSPKFIPRDFLSSYNVLMSPTPKLRWTAERFHKEAEMIHGGFKIVRLMTDLEQLTLKDTADRDTYYRELATCVDTCPTKLSTGLILPKVSSLLQYGGCSAAALVPLLRIARKLSTEAFASKVAPSVLVMFSSNEPLVRMKLLENAELYAPLLPERLVCEKIWPLYLQGLTSKIPEIRELSIRALVHFAPVLTERFTSGDVVKVLLSLQQDAQGAIRTNTTICLGMLARFLPSETRSKTLCNGFGRMLKDPYAPSRAAAVKSIASLAEETFSAQQVCEQLLPALCPLLLDTDRTTRDAATNAVRDLVKQGVSMADGAVPCVATQPAMQQNQNLNQNNFVKSSPAPTHRPQISNLSNTSNNNVSTPIHATAAKKSLDITPMKVTTPVSSSKPANVTSKGWDNDFSDDDDDAVFNTTTTSKKQENTSKTSDAWKDVEFNVAPSAPKKVVATTTAPPVTTVFSSSKKKDDGDFTDVLESTTANGGGGMKLGGTVTKKRGFGVKNN